jgi:glutathione synthase/RimK-type ligase-like ATP-grasp enzyme
MAQLAGSALAAVGADYDGIDLIRTPDGRLMVLEVNRNPSWRGLQSVSEVNIGEAIAEDFLHAVAEHRGHQSEPHPAAQTQPCLA